VDITQDELAAALDGRGIIIRDALHIAGSDPVLYVGYPADAGGLAGDLLAGIAGARRAAGPAARAGTARERLARALAGHRVTVADVERDAASGTRTASIVAACASDLAGELLAGMGEQAGKPPASLTADPELAVIALIAGHFDALEETDPAAVLRVLAWARARYLD
jgi:hypothetical protein